MALEFIAKDEKSGNTGSPTLWVDPDTADVIVQGWRIDDATEADCLKTGSIPDHEAVVRLPARMVTALREACDAAERTGLL
ncbi:hypothetical protein [Kitasatospora sp. P5_F3]